MKIHELKCEDTYFQEIIAGTKPFEVRKNDRGFSVGDILALNEVTFDFAEDPVADNPVADKSRYTGRCCVVEVCNVLDSSRFCKAGFVVLGIRPACVSTLSDRLFSRDWLESYRVPVLGEV